MNKDLCCKCCPTPSVSGRETTLGKTLYDYAGTFAHQVRTDEIGDVIAVLNPESPLRVLLSGHMDEIGLMVTAVTEDGFLKVTRIGGIRTSHLPGAQGAVAHSGRRPVRLRGLHHRFGQKERPAHRRPHRGTSAQKTRPTPWPTWPWGTPSPSTPTAGSSGTIVSAAVAWTTAPGPSSPWRPCRRAAELGCKDRGLRRRHRRGGDHHERRLFRGLPGPAHPGHRRGRDLYQRLPRG